MGTRILLDFDGVLFRNRNIHNEVTKRSIQFVKNNGHFKSNKEANYFNTTKYPVNGHSALILPKHIPVKNAIQNYNNSVFDERLMYIIRATVNEDDYRHLKRVLAIKRSLHPDIQFHLCTSAPMRYCENVMNSLAIPMDLLFDTTCSFTSDTNIVKPQYEYWEAIEKHPYFSSNLETIELVDDSIVNVLSVTNRGRWMPHFINTDQNLYYFLQSLNTE